MRAFNRQQDNRAAISRHDVPAWVSRSRLLGTLSLQLLLVCLGSNAVSVCQGADRPNVVWITSEDNGPHLGCYGDDFADTPHIDALAAKGLVYLNCWSTAPVCAPARTTLISGLYPPSAGAEHMRSMTRLPSSFQMYPQYLRQAGYYCTNNSKEDYNLVKPGRVWDDSSRQAHWRNRGPNQPFFAIFNITVSHESQIRKRPHAAVHDAARVRVPAYHPDTPEVRRDWAQYYDKLTEMDARVGRHLDEIEQAGLADNTIVFYYGDHGSGMPRSKRWPYNSGLHVPLVVHVPERFRHLASQDYQPGQKTDRLVGFIDLAPTLLSLCGVAPPTHFQGHAFMGPHAADEQSYLFGFRGRMDERYDMVRSVRDKRYIYIRNYMPHKIYGQYVDYMFQTPTTRVWKELFDAGRLDPPQTIFWQEKPAEELYDLVHDPDEVNNLADSVQHRDVLRRLRKAQQEWALKIHDVGFLPEAEIHSRSEGSTPYELGHDRERYPLQEIQAVADLAASRTPGKEDALVSALRASDSAIRYWGAMGLLMRGQAGVDAARDALHRALQDTAPSVRVIAAQALGQYGAPEDVDAATSVLLRAARLDDSGIYVTMLALNALDSLDHRAAKVRDEIAELPRQHGSVERRMRNYVDRLLSKALADLDAK